VEAAQKRVEAAMKEAEQLQAKALDVVAEARAVYRDAYSAYRDACYRAGLPCEFSGSRAVNVSERVSFIVEKVNKGVRVSVKGSPESAEVIPKTKLNVSVNKAAYHYTEKHLGPRRSVISLVRWRTG
jgi:hypothetical protein